MYYITYQRKSAFVRNTQCTLQLRNALYNLAQNVLLIQTFWRKSALERRSIVLRVCLFRTARHVSQCLEYRDVSDSSWTLPTSGMHCSTLANAPSEPVTYLSLAARVLCQSWLWFFSCTGFVMSSRGLFLISVFLLLLACLCLQKPAYVWDQKFLHVFWTGYQVCTTNINCYGTEHKLSRHMRQSHWGRTIGWWFSRIGCWGRHLGLRGTRWQGSGEDYITRSFVSTEGF